jgi:hypothetical protein
MKVSGKIDTVANFSFRGSIVYALDMGWVVEHCRENENI